MATKKKPTPTSARTSTASGKDRAGPGSRRSATDGGAHRQGAKKTAPASVGGAPLPARKKGPVHAPPAFHETYPEQEGGQEPNPQAEADADRDQRLVDDMQQNSRRKDLVRHRHEISATVDDEDADDDAADDAAAVTDVPTQKSDK